MKNKKTTKTKPKPQETIKLDLGCGTKKLEGFLGVDILKLEKVDINIDLTKFPWKWKNNSVEEVNCSYFLETLTQEDRCKALNEIYRILKPECKLTIKVAHWAAGKAYGNPTYKFPPISEAWFPFLTKKYRDEADPATNKLLTCDFESTWGYGIHDMLVTRNPEFQQFAVNFYREAAQDIVATATKK